MRLSEKIMDLRKKSGWSQEKLADRLGISRQSVSKWETGESIPDIDKIIRMSELWNVSTDYLLKEEEVLEESGIPESAEKQNSETYQEDSQDFEQHTYEEQKSSKRRRKVSREEVTDFLTLSREAAPRIATGVLLCILSPVCLLVMGVLSA